MDKTKKIKELSNASLLAFTIRSLTDFITNHDIASLNLNNACVDELIERLDIDLNEFNKSILSLFSGGKKK